MPNPVGPIAQAIAEGFKWLKARQDTSEVRRMRKCIDVAEKYIQVNEKSGPYNYEMTDKQKRDKLRYFRNKFFKYNN